jgi:putative hydrolase of the HAD superfamily
MLRYLLFDLDNTLYPQSLVMEHDIVRRMNEYVASYLRVPYEQARELRRKEARRFGTTLEWLVTEKGFSDPESYFAAVHPEGEEYCLAADPALGALLDSIPLPKAVFTNSPREHADRVLRRLGVEDRFESVYDIRFCSLRGKPRVEAFRLVCSACGVSPEQTLFVDDLPRYVEGFLAAGGRGLLIDESGVHADSGLPRIRSLSELPAIVAASSLAPDSLAPG